MSVPALKRVIRLDSMPLSGAQFTPEGYLTDRPILTSVGIFEYRNEDGTPRYELRLPDEVFKKESLESYKGKPIVITHDAGLITKKNVHDEQIGTILSEGYKSGDDVRADIIVHDTDALKRSGLKELSLGYNLDLDETPGEWNGQHYDAIQRNIIINHLALVLEARAGDQARLNIDSRDTSTIKGGKKAMNRKTNSKHSQRNDGVLTAEELDKAIADYKAKRAAGKPAETDGDETTPAAAQNKVVTSKPEDQPAVKADEDMNAEGNPVAKEPTIEDKVAALKDRKDRRDEEGEPEDMASAAKVIANQDADIDSLFDLIDSLLAEREFKAGKADCGTTLDGVEEDPNAPAAPEGNPAAPKATPTPVKKDGDDEDQNCDEDDGPIPTKDKATVNNDSVDKIVRQRVKIGMLGQKLNMDGLEDADIRSAKISIIRKVRPSVRLDGKSDAYVDAMFDLAAEEVNRRSVKGVGYQLRQMFNNDSADKKTNEDSAANARNRMIERRNRGKKED